MKREMIDMENIKRMYHSIMVREQKKQEAFERSDYSNVSCLSCDMLEELYLQEARELISTGKIAVFIMAGGQGTRLNHHGPKGTFTLDLGEFGKKSIFEIHMDYMKFLFLKYGVYLEVFIMTGEENHEDTVRFFEEYEFFGYPKRYIHFLEQNTMPCVDLSGNPIYKSEGEIACSPDGNAGFSEVLKQSGDMKRLLDAGVRYLSVHNVDNILTKFADEDFLASILQNRASLGVKVAQKSSAQEKVGVLLKYKNLPKVIEYSEMPQEILDEKGEDAQLVFGNGVIGSYIFDLEFLNSLEDIAYLYHLAKKKIPYFDGKKLVMPQEENGYKFEAYLFDLFQYAQDIVAYRVDKNLEFAPIKNAIGADSPVSAVKLYYNKLNAISDRAYETYLEYENMEDTPQDKQRADALLEKAHVMYMDIYHMYKNSQALYYLAILSFNQKNYTAAYNNAIQAIRAGLKSDLKEHLMEILPKISDFMYLEKAISLAKRMQYFEALELLESIGETLENSFDYHYYMAFCRRRAGQHNNVEHHLKRAYVINPASAELYAEIAASMMAEGDLEGAKKAIAEGLKIDSNSYELTCTMVEYYDLMNREEDRDACLDKLEELKLKFDESEDM